MRLERPREWGACWLALEMWNFLGLDNFWSKHLTPSRKGTNWLNVLKTLVTYRWISAGSEWRLHRQWFKSSAMADLLGEDDSIALDDTLYRCLDLLHAPKKDLFSFLSERWKTLFNISYDVLLYDLTSTYFEADSKDNERLKKFGYSRDKRSDCVQVVIALIVTKEGFPVAYEVMPGNTQDRTTLPEFLKKIETVYGKLNRLWIMDRGIPTEESLKKMREHNADYLVGTPRGKLSKLEKQLLKEPWKKVQENVKVKLIREEKELYILTFSNGRRDKERSMRQRRLRNLYERLKELKELKEMKKITRDELLMKLGTARKEAGRIWNIIDIRIPMKNEKISGDTFTFKINREKLREQQFKEGTYLLRTNLQDGEPEELWQRYILLTEIEQAFKELKSDLHLRPVYHQLDNRIEAHIFVSFLAYCLQITLKQQAKQHAPGITPRAILEKFKTMQMIDVHLPTTDGRELILPRYTYPEKDIALLLYKLKLKLPNQPPPKIQYQPNKCGADLLPKTQ
ncbi:transposase IS4 family protein [Candidatus Omnitrophus magneticus]|uniref:Transposase IS4 family protein n=2 Tax=Candidatus Omnitrophus magneticus TaxID=1609969 RepID=A0A0F0CS86_9BACT|nr:transposase IS4 family protein [Candidatus Omnitrophus magneticus]